MRYFVHLRISRQLLKNKGKLFLVHRTFRLSEILCQLSKDGLEPKRIRFVHPYIDKEPNIFLLEAVKGGKSRMTVEPPLIVYQKEGKYTEEIYKIYKHEWNIIFVCDTDW